MRIAWLSPLPPSRTGVADYSIDLLPYLMARMEVEVFVEDRRSLLARPGWAVHPVGQLEAQDRMEHFNAIFYHIGNNKVHDYIYRRCLKQKGVIVLHDALIQHLLLGSGWDAWAAEFVHVYGERGREIAATLRNGNTGSHEGFFRYPLIARAARSSQKVIVHNPGARARVEREAPGVAVETFPLPFVRRTPATGRAHRTQARVDLGLSPGAFLVGCFGYLREARRMSSVLRVFTALRERLPKAELLVVGEACSPDFAAALDARLAGQGIRRTGYVSEDEFEQYGFACDVIVNLRYPSAGESSAVAVRMMGLGLPVVLSEIPENSDFPQNACIRVPPGEIEEPLLLEYLLALAADPALGREIGRNAAAYVAREHDPNRAADLYVEVVKSL